jgi:hypothetical protein
MYLIDKKLAQHVINYLGTQAYANVHTMVKGMESMPDYDDVRKTLEEELRKEFVAERDD